MENKLINLSDEELVALAKNGDENAIDGLFSRYTGVVKQTARSFFLFGGDVEDLIQEGMLGLLKAIQNYNGQVQFKGFAPLCIKRQILTAVKTASREKHRPLNDIVDVTSSDDNENFEGYFGDTSLEASTLFDKRETVTEIREKLKSILSNLEYEIIEFYLDGYTYAEIALKTGKSVKTVDNAVQRIRKKIAVKFSV